MKLLFFGDCMFGRKNRVFMENPFKYVSRFIKNVDMVFFNLETNISPMPIEEKYRNNKVFNYQSNGIQLKELRKITDKPIIASIANNHSLDYMETGLANTKSFLNENNILFANYKDYLDLGEFVYVSMSDHCGCNKIDFWSRFIWIVDYNNLDELFKRVSKIKNTTNKKIILSIHWGSNWLDNIPDNLRNLGRKLIEYGVYIIFGHSAHHIPPIPIEHYKDGLIIYGLGDFINDYSVKESYKSDEALMCVVDTKTKEYSRYKVRRIFEGSSSVPHLM